MIKVEIDRFTGMKSIISDEMDLSNSESNYELEYYEPESASKINDMHIIITTRYSYVPHLSYTWNFLIDGSRYNIDAESEIKYTGDEEGSVWRRYLLPYELFSKMTEAKLVEYDSLGSEHEEGSFSEVDILLFKAFNFYISKQESAGLEVIEKINHKLGIMPLSEDEKKRMIEDKKKWDEIANKLSEKGYGSLSEKEKKWLYRDDPKGYQVAEDNYLRMFGSQENKDNKPLISVIALLLLTAYFVIKSC